MKGIIEEKQVKWSDYAPIMVTSLPFYLKAEKGQPVRMSFFPPNLGAKGILSLLNIAGLYCTCCLEWKAFRGRICGEFCCLPMHGYP